jgi:peptide subunit release factor 1 (eRF1)
MTKLNRHIRKLIQSLLNNTVSAIYPSEVAHQLQCPVEAVENILIIMEEDDLLQHRYELHCRQCGEVMSVFESPKLLTSAPFPSPSCESQAESLTMNDTVSAFYPVNVSNSLTASN